VPDGASVPLHHTHEFAAEVFPRLLGHELLKGPGTKAAGDRNRRGRMNAISGSAG
jgi:hypothetical protein